MILLLSFLVMLASIHGVRLTVQMIDRLPWLETTPDPEQLLLHEGYEEELQTADTLFAASQALFGIADGDKSGYFTSPGIEGVRGNEQRYQIERSAAAFILRVLQDPQFPGLARSVALVDLTPLPREVDDQKVKLDRFTIAHFAVLRSTFGSNVSYPRVAYTLPAAFLAPETKSWAKKNILKPTESVYSTGPENPYAALTVRASREQTLGILDEMLCMPSAIQNDRSQTDLTEADPILASDSEQKTSVAMHYLQLKYPHITIDNISGTDPSEYAQSGYGSVIYGGNCDNFGKIDDAINYHAVAGQSYELRLVLGAENNVLTFRLLQK